MFKSLFKSQVSSTDIGVPSQVDSMKSAHLPGPVELDLAALQHVSGGVSLGPHGGWAIPQPSVTGTN